MNCIHYTLVFTEYILDYLIVFSFKGVYIDYIVVLRFFKLMGDTWEHTWTQPQTFMKSYRKIKERNLIEKQRIFLWNFFLCHWIYI